MEKTGNLFKHAYESVKHNLTKIGIIGLTTLASFLPMKTEAQTPTNAIEHIGNPFVQPTDPEVSKNWYGSGDVNNDNIVNQEDVNKLEQVINGSFSDPSDTRLMKRSDVNWDGNVNNSDKQILQEYVNGTRDHLIGYWNELETREEKEELLQKFANVAQLNKICETWFSEGKYCDCNQRSEVTMLITNKWDATRDIPRFLEFDPEYIKFIPDTNLYNLPVMQLDLQDNNGEFGHAYNTIVVGDNALLQSNRCDIEPSQGWINSPVISTSGDAIVLIRGHPTIPDEVPLYTDLGGYFKYNVNDFIPSDAINLYEEMPYISSHIPTITQRENNNPEINIISPEEGKFYNSSPNLESNITDENVYNRYDLEADGVTKNYYNPHNSIKLNSERINDNQIFNYTNRNLEEITGGKLIDGNYQLILRSKDALGNESSETRNFSIDSKKPEIKVDKPNQGELYNQDVNFQYELQDTNLDLDKSSYILNGMEYNFSQHSGAIPITSKEGENKLEIIAKDLAGNQSDTTITYKYSPQTGLEDISSENEIIAFPIPSKSNVNFKLKNPMGEDREIKIYSPSGELVGGKKTNGELLEYDISKHPYGFLIYQLLDEKGKTIGSGKIVKE